MVSGLIAQETNPARGVNFYSIEKEQALGAQLAREYRRDVTVIEDAAVKAYLDDLGQRLAAKAGGPAFRYTFELVSDDGIVLNEPVAFPGGTVFVSTGLIRAARSEDELAGTPSPISLRGTGRNWQPGENSWTRRRSR